MKQKEQFKIETEEELREAYEMFKDKWWNGCSLSDDLKNFRGDSAVRYVMRGSNIGVFLSIESQDYKTIPSPLKNKNMLNKELIQRLRDGEIAVVNNGTLEELQAVFKEAFPKDIMSPKGTYKFYYSIDNRWCATINDKYLKETVSVKNFFNIKYPQQSGRLNRPVLEKYVLKDKSYDSSFPEVLLKDDSRIKVYKGLKILDKLYKPIYKKVEPKLPEINGYKGEVVSKWGEVSVKYGCAFLDLGWFRSTENRNIHGMTLSSGVILEKSEVEQIRKYLVHYGHI